MQGIARRGFVAGALLLGLGEAFAAAPMRKENAWRVHRRRYIDRRDQRLYQNQIEPQRSRPVPSTSPGSSVVPNR